VLIDNILAINMDVTMIIGLPAFKAGYFIGSRYKVGDFI
jgi:hypothetical protein